MSYYRRKSIFFSFISNTYRRFSVEGLEKSIRVSISFFALSNPVISCYRLTKSSVIHFTLQLHFSKKFSTPVGFCHTFNFRYGRCSLTQSGKGIQKKKLTGKIQLMIYAAWSFLKITAAKLLILSVTIYYQIVKSNKFYYLFTLLRLSA